MLKSIKLIFISLFVGLASANDYIGVMLVVNNSTPFKNTKPPIITGYLPVAFFDEKKICEINSRGASEELFTAATSAGIQVSEILSRCILIGDHVVSNQAVGFTVFYPRVSEPNVFSRLLGAESFRTTEECEAIAEVKSEKNYRLRNIARDYSVLLCKEI